MSIPAFGSLVADLFSRRLEQLNVPLRSIETSRGMTSRVFNVVEQGDRAISVAWIKTLRESGRVVYCGTYATCEVLGF